MRWDGSVNPTEHPFKAVEWAADEGLGWQVKQTTSQLKGNKRP